MAQITQLTDLNEINDNDFTAVFIKSMDMIFKWAHSDITSTLDQRSEIPLTNLRNTLCEQTKGTFPEINNKMPIKRRKKHLLIKDVCVLGDCLVKNVANSELDSTVQPKKKTL